MWKFSSPPLNPNPSTTKNILNHLLYKGISGKTWWHHVKKPSYTNRIASPILCGCIYVRDPWLGSEGSLDQNRDIYIMTILPPVCFHSSFSSFPQKKTHGVDYILHHDFNLNLNVADMQKALLSCDVNFEVILKMVLQVHFEVILARPIERKHQHSFEKVGCQSTKLSAKNLSFPLGLANITSRCDFFTDLMNLFNQVL